MDRPFLIGRKGAIQAVSSRCRVVASRFSQ